MENSISMGVMIMNTGKQYTALPSKINFIMLLTIKCEFPQIYSPDVQPTLRRVPVFVFSGGKVQHLKT